MKKYRNFLFIFRIVFCISIKINKLQLILKIVYNFLSLMNNFDQSLYLKYQSIIFNFQKSDSSTLILQIWQLSLNAAFSAHSLQSTCIHFEIKTSFKFNLHSEQHAAYFNRLITNFSSSSFSLFKIKYPFNYSNLTGSFRLSS